MRGGSWIVELWAGVFGVLARVSPIGLIGSVAPAGRIDHRFIDT